MENLLKNLSDGEQIIREYRDDLELCKKAGEKELDCIKLVDLKYTRKFPQLKDLVYPWVNYDWDYSTFVDNNYDKQETGANDRTTLGGLFDNMDAMNKLNGAYIYNANPSRNSQAASSDLNKCDPSSNDYAGCTIINEIKESQKGQRAPYPDPFFNRDLSGENSSSFFIKAGTCPKPNLNKKECLAKRYQWVENPLFNVTPASLRPSDFLPGSCFKPRYAYIKNTPGLKIDFSEIENINKDIGNLSNKAAGEFGKLAGSGAGLMAQVDPNQSNQNTQMASQMGAGMATTGIQAGVGMSNMGLEMAKGPINAELSQYKGASPSIMGDAISINPLALWSITNGHSAKDLELMECEEGFTNCSRLITPSSRERWWTTFLFVLILTIIVFVLLSFAGFKNRK